MKDLNSSNGKYESLPNDLLLTSQWICWRYKERNGSKPAKVPIDPQNGTQSDITDEDTGSSIINAIHFHVNGRPFGSSSSEEEETDGIGFVFTPDDPFVGIDLDDCVSDSTIEDWAQGIISAVNTYTEYSPSGTGLHCLCVGSLPNGNARGDNIEFYEEDRFFTVTGDTVPRQNLQQTISNCATRLGLVYHVVTSENQEGNQNNQMVDDSENSLTTGGGNCLSDEELLNLAMSARNGDKFKKLWEGNTGGYSSHSEADNALCAFLAFWSGGDRQQIDRIFRNSGMYRRKWDEPRGDQTYGDLTIKSAIEQTKEFYEC